jgi:ABC-2 type transport system ATP-binding protein
MPAIRTEALRKEYRLGFWRRRVPVLHALDLCVERGETFGFLGPNGAGKTTTLKLLMGLVQPSGGRAWLLDRDVREAETRRSVGFLPEMPSFYDYLSGAEFLGHMARLAGLGGGEAREQIRQLLDRVGLSAAARLQLRKYSKGMLQRLGLAQALLGDPALVLLDEPMSGLDPIGRKEVRDIILRLRAEGRTVFFSSHIIPDMEMICDRVGILLRGRLVRVGRLDELLGSQVESTELTAVGLPAATVEAIAASATGSPLRQGERVLFRFGEEAAVDKALREVLDAGGRVVALTPQKRSLEELFLSEVRAEANR